MIYGKRFNTRKDRKVYFIIFYSDDFREFITNNFIVDTYIVGKYIGSNALVAVGSSYALMIFLTSIIIGLCMGSGIFNVFWS